MMPTFEHIQEEIANMLDIPDDELSEEQRAVMDQYLDELGNQEAAKVDSFAQFIKVQTEIAKVCKAEAARLEAKAKAAENRIGDLKRRYLEIMASHHLNKVKGNIYTISVGRSEAASVPENDMEYLAALYADMPELVHREIIYKPNRPAIKKCIKAGENIPGCGLAITSHLRIR